MTHATHDHHALLDQAATLLHPPPTKPSPDITDLLHRAQALVTRDLPAHRTALSAISHRFAGIPATPNPWAVLSIGRGEAPVTQLLAWLADPRGDHGLGDAVLRAFLLRTDAPALRRLARTHHPIEAHVFAEVSFPNGVPDLVIVTRDHVIIVEVKVDAKVHLVPGYGGVPQTTAYRRDAATPAVHQTLGRLTGLGATSLADHTVTCLFAAPRDSEPDPRDAAYRPLHLDEAMSATQQAMAVACLSQGQLWALRGVVTQLLHVSSTQLDPLELLAQTRTLLVDPTRRHAPATALRARQLHARWTTLLHGESDA